MHRGVGFAVPTLVLKSSTASQLLPRQPMDELPLRVRKVRIVGNKRTRPYVVEDELQVCPAVLIRALSPTVLSRSVMPPLGVAAPCFALLYSRCRRCCNRAIDQYGRKYKICLFFITSIKL